MRAIIDSAGIYTASVLVMVISAPIDPNVGMTSAGMVSASLYIQMYSRIVDIPPVYQIAQLSGIAFNLLVIRSHTNKDQDQFNADSLTLTWRVAVKTQTLPTVFTIERHIPDRAAMPYHSV